MPVNLDDFVCDYHYKCLQPRKDPICPHYPFCDMRKLIYQKCKVVKTNGNRKRKHLADINPHDPVRRNDVKLVFYEAMTNGRMCPYCRRRMNVYGNTGTSMTVDHIRARSLDGNNDVDNLVVCCADCNQQKAARESKLFSGKVKV